MIARELAGISSYERFLCSSFALSRCWKWKSGEREHRVVRSVSVGFQTLASCRPEPLPPSKLALVDPSFARLRFISSPSLHLPSSGSIHSLEPNATTQRSSLSRQPSTPRPPLRLLRRSLRASSSTLHPSLSPTRPSRPSASIHQQERCTLVVVAGQEEGQIDSVRCFCLFSSDVICRQVDRHRLQELYGSQARRSRCS
jgi:hypothetical protein